MYNCINYLELLNTLTSNLHSRVALSSAKLSIEDEFIMKTLENTYSGSKKTWSRLIELSKEMSSIKGSEYTHMLITVYFAFRCINHDENVSYLQMPPGSGKTWVGLLIATYLINFKGGLSPVYVCLNSVLQEQVKEKAKTVGLKSLKVI